ncbi:UNVERIFIED_CONTAM: hypothetical protein GTU68_039928, partial [Idotea baltica]|nr:hypothetical protein [Idotea baltica]
TPNFETSSIDVNIVHKLRPLFWPSSFTIRYLPAGEAVAFEVVDESLIRKHPPKKFQKLEDIQSSTNMTPEELQMKQEIAKKRRQNILNKRVQSAKQRSAKSAHIRSSLIYYYI